MLAIIFNDSAHDGFGHGQAVSPITAWSFLWKRINTQSMIRIIKCGGRPNFRTVARVIKN